MQAERHMSPTEWLDSLGVFNGRTVAAHCVWMSDHDMDHSEVAQRRRGA